MAKTGLCSIDGCGKPVKGRGWCAMHLWRFHKHGSPNRLAIKQPLPPDCTVEGCDEAPERGRKGMCARHYRMSYRRGTTVPKMARRGEPEKWLKGHVAHNGADCLIWPFAKHRDGTAAIASRYSRQAARTMCILAHGNPPTISHQAAHNCGKGHLGCVNPQHLRWATPVSNTEDKRGHGTMLRGEQIAASKLTGLKVIAIRELAGKFTIPDLAEIFDVHAWTVKDIIDRKTWAWLV